MTLTPFRKFAAIIFCCILCGCDHFLCYAPDVCGGEKALEINLINKGGNYYFSLREEYDQVMLEDFRVTKVESGHEETYWAIKNNTKINSVPPNINMPLMYGENVVSAIVEQSPKNIERGEYHIYFFFLINSGLKKNELRQAFAIFHVK